MLPFAGSLSAPLAELARMIPHNIRIIASQSNGKRFEAETGFLERSLLSLFSEILCAITDTYAAQVQILLKILLEAFRSLRLLLD